MVKSGNLGCFTHRHIQSLNKWHQAVPYRASRCLCKPENDKAGSYEMILVKRDCAEKSVILYRLEEIKSADTWVWKYLIMRKLSDHAMGIVQDSHTA